MASDSPWFIYTSERKQKAGFRLFCFHYAGAGGSIFRAWPKWLDDDIELVAVQLPGRESRVDEPLLESMDLVMAPLVKLIPPLLDRPFGLFGHSTGAMISFELARSLRRQSLPEPAVLIASSQNAPRIRPPVVRHKLADPEFIDILRSCNGTPKVVLDNQALLEFLLPRIRADGAVYETYRYHPDPPLSCRIVVLYGRDDTMVHSAGLESWKEETMHSFQQYAFPGGHFFLHDAEEEVVSRINCEIEPFMRSSCADRAAAHM